MKPVFLEGDGFGGSICGVKHLKPECTGAWTGGYPGTPQGAVACTDPAHQPRNRPGQALSCPGGSFFLPTSGADRGAEAAVAAFGLQIPAWSHSLGPHTARASCPPSPAQPHPLSLLALGASLGLSLTGAAGLSGRARVLSLAHPVTRKVTAVPLGDCVEARC